MKKNYILLFLLSLTISFAQDGAPAAPYYNGFNWTLTGTSLKNALATKITSTHTNLLTYQEAENAIKIVDLDPTDTSNNNVFLLYGFSPSICPASASTDNDHRKRNKNSDGGGASCEWNREHVFPQSLGNPALGQSGPGADAQMLRACDVQRNGDRGNKKYAAGSGNSGTVGSNWYPGDEWKGDCARILMYMYLHYGNQCLPTSAVAGTTVASDSNMLNILLQWNAEDPVSQYEDNRNTYLGNTSNAYGQGNRNPFIDNPYLATVIWGGPAAQNRWPSLFLSAEDFVNLDAIAVYPNPSNDNRINIETEIALDEIQLINLNGQLIQVINKPKSTNNTYSLDNLPQGFYLLKLSSENQSTVKKIIVN